MDRALDRGRRATRATWIRGGLAAVVLAAVAMPAARVYMYDRPLIESLTMVDGDDEVNTVSGHGLPNSLVEVWYRQRNFHQGDLDGAGPQFSWCGGYNTGWIWAGASLTSSTGAWSANVKSRQIVAYPSGVWTTQSTAPCTAGLVTEFMVKHTTDTNPAGITATDEARVPDLRWFRVKKPANGDQQGGAFAVVDNAYNASLSIADGPNDASNPHGTTTRDVNASGWSCDWAGPCPRQIRFTGTDTPVAPTVTVIQDNVFPTDTDPEFPYLLGQMSASSAGGGIFVAAKRDRPNITGAATIKIVIKLPNIALDCGGGFDPTKLFDFFGF
jgi:hypothetical protein